MNENDLKRLVRHMIDEALIERGETAMVRVNRKEAFDKVAGLWKRLNEHIVKIVMWGDSRMWRKEVSIFAKDIHEVELKLKSRKKLTIVEHQDAMTDYRSTAWGKGYFKTEINNIRMDMSYPPKRDEEEGRKIAYSIQLALLHTFAYEKSVDTNKILDDILSKYPKIEYRP